MSEPFLGEIRLFAGNFAPRGWALCAGQMLSTEIPAHTHAANCSSGQTTTQPEGAYWGSGGRGASLYASAPSVNLAVNAASPAGGSMPHNNMQPYLGMTYIIALEGVFPSRP